LLLDYSLFFSRVEWIPVLWEDNLGLIGDNKVVGHLTRL